jgi:uncharacterized membrane protein
MFDRLAPLTDEGWLITLRASTAAVSLLLGIFILVRPKGSLVHRALGYAWLVGMALAVLSSLFISQIRVWGPFSPIHLLSVFTLFSLFYGWRAARRHDRRAHQITMIATWVDALGLNFWFTLLPGRVMHEVFFGPT